jgi:hypothetical protein
MIPISANTDIAHNNKKTGEPENLLNKGKEKRTPPRIGSNMIP